MSDADLLDDWRSKWRRENHFCVGIPEAGGIRHAFCECVPLIAAGLSPLAPERELMAASRFFLQEIESCIVQAEDFAFETTLAGRSYLKLVRRLRAAGWRVELIYLALPSREMSRLRVAERVAHGGHNIPAADIERRFARSLANLLTTFSPVVDACRCFMNSGAMPELVFEQHGEQRKISRALHYQNLLKESEP